ncbi:HTTM domain-containing protein [Gelidibacter salicanalis]|uniref:HTTM domain-containing protein n=2 Tax=Gelidibacter salicanalis TaxID=291193 RepID=A0A934KP69_9FLAO|nr:HTTM domain-containing protein [Gelidibacter salicanalis]
MSRLLFKYIDNSALIVFRIIFGFLIIMESVGAIYTGWIRRTLMDPQVTFSFIGFEWLQPLPGNGMYFYYGVMGLCGLFIMIGYKYRWSMLAFTMLWTGTYLMQKSSYNNHYYLLVLLSAIMVFQPAHKYLSVDARLNPKIKMISMPSWCALVFILQMFIVYTYGAIAKIYPDWLDASVAEILMKSKKDYFLVGELLQQRWTHYTIAYVGILFDALIIPLLLWKRTRKFAFFASIFFHLFNSFVFQIGIFPYLSLAFALFFFPTTTIHRIFLKRKPYYEQGEVIVPNYHKPFIAVFVIYFIVQVTLPSRHWFIKDDVLWTEEGHRLSWRMMLRAKSGHTTFKVVDAKTNLQIPVQIEDYLSPKQLRSVSTKPDVIWQFAQRLKQIFADQGREVKVYVNASVRVNGGELKQLIDPEVDLANEKWHPLRHSNWLLPSQEEKLPKE